MVQHDRSQTLERAIEKYPSLKSTITKAKKAGIEISQHIAMVSNGRVFQHRFLIMIDGKLQNWTNQHLSSFLKIYGYVKKENI